VEKEEVLTILTALKAEHERMAKGWATRPGEVPKKRAVRELKKAEALEVAIFVLGSE
jgi:hypothetical protein